MTNTLPIHPRTGLQAIGFGKRGPIWPVVGGSVDADISQMSLEQVRTAATELLDSTTGDLVGADAERFQALTSRAEELRAHQVQRSEARAEVLRLSQSGAYLLERGDGGNAYDRDPVGDHRDIGEFRGKNPWALQEMQTLGRDPDQVSSELRSRALSAVERMSGASDGIRSAATKIIEDADAEDSRLARHVLITSNPDYMRAWSKMAKNPRLHPLLQRAKNFARCCMKENSTRAR